MLRCDSSNNLVAALNSGGGGLNNVYRQGVAALLNAAVYGARTGYNIIIVQNEFKLQAESTKPSGEGLEDLALWCHGGKTPGTTPAPTPGGDVPPPPISAGDQYGNNGGYGNGNKTNDKPNDNGGKGKGNNTTAGPPLVVTAVYSITFQANKKNAENELVKIMRSYAERAGIAKQNFIINGGDIQQNRTVITRWSIKVGFKSKNPVERAMDLDRFTNFLYAQAGLGAIRTASGNGEGAAFTTDEEQVIAYNLETMSVQTCDDGSDISANDVCPVEVSAAGTDASPSTSSSRSLLPMIIGVAAAVVVLLIVISSIIIIRRRRHNSIKAISNITADQVAQQV